jgi:hypothetical protein
MFDRALIVAQTQNPSGLVKFASDYASMETIEADITASLWTFGEVTRRCLTVYSGRKIA